MRQWLRTAEPLGERRYENWNTHTHTWLESINQGSLIGAVMVDFKKAFDLVDHAILLEKLKHYKLTNNTISWFQSYLNKRKQKVSLNNTMSDDEVIISRVPQGSI